MVFGFGVELIRAVPVSQTHSLTVTRDQSLTHFLVCSCSLDLVKYASVIGSGTYTPEEPLSDRLSARTCRLCCGQNGRQMQDCAVVSRTGKHSSAEVANTVAAGTYTATELMQFDVIQCTSRSSRSKAAMHVLLMQEAPMGKYGEARQSKLCYSAWREKPVHLN